MYILWFFCRYTNPAYVGKVHSRLLVYIVRVRIVPPNGLRILPWIDWQKFIFVRTYRSCVHHIIHVILFWIFISISAWVSVRCARFTFDDVGPNVVRKIGRLVRCNWAKPIFAFKQLNSKIWVWCWSVFLVSEDEVFWSMLLSLRVEIRMWSFGDILGWLS